MALSIATKFGYGIGHILNDLCASIWFTYALVYYNVVIGLKDVEAGALILIGQVADGIATVIIGILMDRWVINKRLYRAYGRRKVWHLIGTLGIIILMPILFTPCHICSSRRTTMAFFAVFIIIFQIYWAEVQISHLSLASDLTLDPNERIQLLSLRSMFAVLSNLLLYAVAWGVLAIDTKNPKDNLSSKNVKQFQIIVYSAVAFGAVTSLLFHFLVDEKSPRQSVEGKVSRQKKLSEIFLKPLFFLIAVMYMFSRLYGNINQVLIPFYVREVMTLGAPGVAIIPLVMYISSFLTTLFIAFVNIRFGRLVAYLYGTIVGSLAIALEFYGSNQFYSTYVVYLTAILLGSCQAAYLVTSLGVIADYIGDDTKNGAIVFGAMSLIDKLLSGIVIITIQALKTNKPNYHQLAMLITSGSAIIGGTVCMIFIYVIMYDRTSLNNEVSPGTANS